MPHDPLNERLSAYLDGELSAPDRTEVEALLREQPELVETLDELKQLGEGIRQLPRESLGPHFADQVLAAIERTGPSAARPAHRRSWLLAAGAIAAAVAAVFLVVIANRPDADKIAEPPALSPAEQAVAAVLEPVQEGQAVIVRLRLTKDAIRGKALDQALAAHGIAAAPASAVNPAAQESAQAYKQLTRDDAQPGSAADVLFIEAEADKLQKALAQVAVGADGTSVISSGGVVISTASGIDRLTKMEGETGTSTQDIKVDAKNYAQHLPARGFPLLKPDDAAPTTKAGPVTKRTTPARVLVVVEVMP